jgi:hypothetical protein
VTAYPEGFHNWPLEQRNAFFAAEARRYDERQEAVRRAMPIFGALPTLPTASPGWPSPKPIPDGLKPVDPYSSNFLPDSIAPWVDDIADRMQCPPDYVAVAAIVALGATLGRKVGIKPQSKTDWVVVPNLWGVIVGRPGAMKSPAMAEALKPLRRLEALARDEYAATLADFNVAMDEHKLKREDATRRAREALKKGIADIADLLDLSEPPAPAMKRFIVNDCTYEALGEVLAANPNGVLAYRDELVSLLKTLDREDHAAARGFFLTGWNGTDSYSFDRIIRGKTHVEAACLSMLGSTQPGLLGDYIGRAVRGGSADDGLMQRFQLLVWPDQWPDWKDVDRWPREEARSAAFAVFQRLATLTPDDIGATRNDYVDLPFLRFEEAALSVFIEWRTDLERRLRDGSMSPAIESHLAKYRKLVPALALINHVVDHETGAVGELALTRAIAFSAYLETHAQRAYAAGLERESVPAKAILTRIKKAELVDGFTAREVHRRQWTHLTEREAIKAALELLIDLDCVRENVSTTGGRPLVTYSINPGLTI